VPKDAARRWHEVVIYERITTDPAVMGGLPCIRGLRFPVATVLAMLADGTATEDILAEHPGLTAEDIHESLASQAAPPLIVKGAPNDAPMSCQGLFRLAWLVDFGVGEGIAFTRLLGADKTGRGRSGQEGRLLLGHAASSRDGVRGRPTDRSKASTSAAAD
jgi:uncharacterized protein (DUF433 family)